MNYHLSVVLVLVARYLHIACATILVGGTLFYEMVVPLAIDDLRPEQKMVVFARARWVFRGIVWISVLLILAGGVVTTYVNWPQYMKDTYRTSDINPAIRQGESDSNSMPIPAGSKPGMWWAAHASAGVIALIIAMGLTMGNVPPTQPIRWMRINLVILLLVMFLATVTRQARMQQQGTFTNPWAKSSLVILPQ